MWSTPSAIFPRPRRRCRHRRRLLLQVRPPRSSSGSGGGGGARCVTSEAGGRRRGGGRRRLCGPAEGRPGGEGQAVSFVSVGRGPGGGRGLQFPSPGGASRSPGTPACFRRLSIHVACSTHFLKTSSFPVFFPFSGPGLRSGSCMSTIKYQLWCGSLKRLRTMSYFCISRPLGFYLHRKC